MCQLVHASVSENQVWWSVKFQNKIKVVVLDTEPLRIPRAAPKLPGLARQHWRNGSLNGDHDIGRFDDCLDFRARLQPKCLDGFIRDRSGDG